MQINRHNYEEFFILYMDNELTVEERRSVEDFVALHPDLRDELELLQHFKLQPDTEIVYAGKEELLKINGDTPVTLTNYEEWFTQYTDGELTGSQRKAVEDFIENNPSTAKDLLLFQRTRLQPETVLFPDKASLYRKEKERRVIPIRWWRIAAAAVLVLGIGLTTYFALDKKPASDIDGGLATAAEKQPAVIEKKVKDVVDENEKVLSPTGKEQAPLLAKNIDEPVNKTSIVRDQKAPEQVTPVVVDVTSKEDMVQVQRDNNLPKPVYNPNLKMDLPSTDIAVTQPPVQQKKTLTEPAVTSRSNESLDVVNASFRDEGDERQDGKKNKLRGFFRKVTRTFEKRTNMDATTDDDKLLVAGLAISLK